MRRAAPLLLALAACAAAPVEDRREVTFAGAVYPVVIREVPEFGDVSEILVGPALGAAEIDRDTAIRVFLAACRPGMAYDPMNWDTDQVPVDAATGARSFIGTC